ncbi:MAG: SRPBCC family protein [Thermoplasmata archaeon]|nr:MAG: SRPBCC family protein [Thermoplasmata archaeon]
MMTLTDSIEIKVKPEIVFKWFKNIDRYYKEWHPDHVKWVNETGGFKVGAICYAEEYLCGELEKLRAKYIEIEKNKKIVYKMLFPTSIICTKGSFIIEPKNGNSIFTATLTFRGGKILSKLFRSRIEEIKKHQKEEGENLKIILETQNLMRTS